MSESEKGRVLPWVTPTDVYLVRHWPGVTLTMLSLCPRQHVRNYDKLQSVSTAAPRFLYNNWLGRHIRLKRITLYVLDSIFHGGVWCAFQLELTGKSHPVRHTHLDQVGCWCQSFFRLPFPLPSIRKHSDSEPPRPVCVPAAASMTVIRPVSPWWTLSLG